MAKPYRVVYAVHVTLSFLLFVGIFAITVAARLILRTAAGEGKARNEETGVVTDVELVLHARYRIFGYCEDAYSPENGVDVDYEDCGTYTSTLGGFYSAGLVAVICTGVVLALLSMVTLIRTCYYLRLKTTTEPVMASKDRTIRMFAACLEITASLVLVGALVAVSEYKDHLAGLDAVEGPLQLSPITSLTTELEPMYYVLAVATALLCATGVIGIIAGQMRYKVYYKQELDILHDIGDREGAELAALHAMQGIEGQSSGDEELTVVVKPKQRPKPRQWEGIAREEPQVNEEEEKKTLDERPPRMHPSGSRVSPRAQRQQEGHFEAAAQQPAPSSPRAPTSEQGIPATAASQPHTPPQPAAATASKPVLPPPTAPKPANASARSRLSPSVQGHGVSPPASPAPSEAAQQPGPQRVTLPPLQPTPEKKKPKALPPLRTAPKPPTTTSALPPAAGLPRQNEEDQEDDSDKYIV